MSQSGNYGTGRKPRAWKRRRKPTPQAPVVVMLAPTPTPIALMPSPPPPLTAADRARISKWIRDRLTAAWPSGCWACRRPFTFGQKFIDVRGADVTVRFHRDCHAEWLAQQEVLARRALGLDQ